MEEFDDSQMHRIETRVRRLNALGFDVAELDITTDFAGATVRIQPKVVDAGHHQRRLLRLTGLDTEENQARRLLNDLDYYRARTDQQGADESIVAHQWLTEVFEPVVTTVPAELRAKLEPAELYHEVLEHRWFMGEQAGTPIDMPEAAQSYMKTVLTRLPDEEIALPDVESAGPLANPYDPSQGFLDEETEKPYDPWEDGDEAPGADEADEPAGRLSRHRRAARKNDPVSEPGLQKLGEDLITTAARMVRWVPKSDDIMLSLAAARILARLNDSGPTRISDLAAAERSSQPTITNHVKRLEALRLVERQTHPGDARAWIISLTADG